MIIIIGLAILVVVGVMIQMRTDFIDEGLTLAVASGCILTIALIMIPVSRVMDRTTIVSHYSLAETIEVSRTENISEIERAALLTTIANHNQTLASARYFNNTTLDIYIVDELAELPFLK